MSRAIFYIRVSTAEQVTNYSLDTQLRSCMEHCKKNEIEVDRIFEEKGESAKTADRRQLTEMLEYCRTSAKSRGIDLLLVYKLDRLARQMVDHTAIRMALNKFGVKVRSVQETFDDSASGKFTENMMAAMAQFDNDVRAARTIAGMKEGLSRGRWTFQAPVGYMRPRDAPIGPSLVPDPDSAPLIRLAFELMSTHEMTKQVVLERMTSLGLKNRRGKKIPTQTFGMLLRNPIYTGRIVVPKWDIDCLGDFEPIIDRALFDAVQSSGSAKGSHRDRRSLDHPDFPLRRAVKTLSG